VPLEGGHLALDFVNTLDGQLNAEREPSNEHLRSYRDLLVWSVRAGALSESGARRLERVASIQPRRAEAVLAEALTLRDLLYSVFRPLSEGRSAPAEPLDALANRERVVLRRAELSGMGDRYGWAWPEVDDLRRPLWPLPHAAVDLLNRGPLDRLKPCGECRWLFLDRSKNRSRRWCSMERCGTNVKMRRQTERRRLGRAGLTSL